jgi:hypothetical protein
MTMKTKQTLPIILARDEAAINDFRQRLEDLFPSVAQMVDHYFRFPFAHASATPQTIYSNTSGQAENFKSTHLPENIDMPDGMEIDRQRFGKFLKIKGMDEFQDACDKITATSGQTLLSYFKIVDQLPEIDEAKFSLYADAHSVMAKTASDIQLYRAWVRMIEGLTEFDALVKQRFTFLVGLHAPKLGMYLKTDRDGKIVPSPTLFEAIAKQLNKKHEEIQQ